MTLAYVNEDGVFLFGFEGPVPPPAGAFEVPSCPEDARQIWDFVAEEWGPIPPPPPSDQEPTRIACALRVPVIDDEVQAVGGPYRLAAMLYMDVGTFLAIFTQNLGASIPFLVPNNGVSIEITDWGGDYAMIEVRDHAGGSLITPQSFGFSLYEF
jgi:hypothetical protein